MPTLHSEMSRPVLGAWIETSCHVPKSIYPMSRPVLGAWIETFANSARSIFCCRAPCWARGLKLCRLHPGDLGRKSRPVLGAWIETCYRSKLLQFIKSRPVLGAWIETVTTDVKSLYLTVAPRAGRVD